jgi:hypothetical protein
MHGCGIEFKGRPASVPIGKICGFSLPPVFSVFGGGQLRGRRAALAGRPVDSLADSVQNN